MVKKVFVGFGMLLLLIAPVFGLEQKTVLVPSKKAVVAPGDDAGVKAAFERFSKAWEVGDAKARAEVFTTDGSIINPFGQEAWGRTEIQRLFEQESATIAKGTKHTFDHFRITFLMPTVALVDCDGTISGIKNPAGQDMPNQKVHVFVVAVKRSRDWQVRFARPAIFAPLPGTESSEAVSDPTLPEVQTDKP